MTITQLEIQNVKRISAFAVANDGESIILTGDNAQGKSSVLDSILLALKNQGLEDPIRHGANKARISLTLGAGEDEYLVERSITPKGRSLKITKADGTPIPSPQAFLDKLTGSLAFDPLEFVRVKPKFQAAMIRELTGLDTSALDENYKSVYAQRTEVNRTAEALKAQIQGMPVTSEKLPVPERMNAQEVVAKRDNLKSEINRLEAAIESSFDAQEELKQLGVEIERLKAELEAKNARWSELYKSLPKIKAEAQDGRQKVALLEQQLELAQDELANVDLVNAQISDVEAKNAAIDRNNATRAQKIAEYKAADKRSQELTDKLEAINAEKFSLSQKVQMPVEGMTFDDAGVLIDGIRFDQLSTAEQVRVSTKVAMAANPALRVIMIREGALINKANLKEIMASAKEGGYQIWMERFQEEPGAEGIHIEDGSITHIDGHAITAEAEETQTEAEEFELV